LHLARLGVAIDQVGELIVVERWKEKAVSESTGRSYTPYKAWFIDRPKRSAKDILGITSDIAADETDFVANEARNNGQDEDIPF
jgi:hypothetical protein